MKTNIQKFESIVANKVSGWHEKSKNRIKAAKTYNEYYAPLSLKIIGYATPKAFANSEYKPFGDIPDEYWKNYAGITEGKMVAFVTKNPNELHFYKEHDCSFDEIIELIGHELGHFQPKIVISLNEEIKADRYSLFAKQVYEVSCLIKGSLTDRYRHSTITEQHIVTVK